MEKVGGGQGEPAERRGPAPAPGRELGQRERGRDFRHYRADFPDREPEHQHTGRGQRGRQRQACRARRDQDRCDGERPVRRGRRIGEEEQAPHRCGQENQQPHGQLPRIE